MSFQQKAAAEGVPPSVIFGLSLLFVFLILAAHYESWSLPFSVLLGTPVAVFGAFALAHEYTKYQAGHATAGRVLIAVGFTLAFAWFGVSSFWRVRRKTRLRE